MSPSYCDCEWHSLKEHDNGYHEASTGRHRFGYHMVSERRGNLLYLLELKLNIWFKAVTIPLTNYL